MELYLTRNGLLYSDGGYNARHAFYTNTGEFLRQCSNDEFNHLINEVGLPRINFEPTGGSQSFQIFNQASEELAMKLGDNMPVWTFLTSILVKDDMSNYKSETCNNGGNYSFHTYHDWYVAQYPDGKWRFMVVTLHSTSAEFSYDELNGSFQTGLNELVAINCIDSQSWTTQTGGKDQYEVLEKIGEFAGFSDMWDEMYHYIPSKYDMYEIEKRQPALSISNKKKILTKLFELGWNCSPKQKK